MTIIATPGATNANSYATLADADVYFNTRRLHASVWLSIDTSDEDLEKALIWATSILDRLMDWSGTVRHYGVGGVGGQALRWPRSGTTDPDGRWYDYDSIPAPVFEATCELANLLLQKDREAVPDLLGQGFRSIDVKDVISLTVDREAVLPLIPTAILGILSGIGTINGLGNSGFVGDRVVRLSRV